MKIGNQFILGIEEHISRINLLHKLSIENSNKIDSYRLLLLSIYSCRAIVELILEAAEKGEIRKEIFPNSDNIRASLEIWIKERIKYYDLIEKIRIHDFHRFGIIPFNQSINTFQMNGPVKMIAQNGSIQIQYPDGIPNYTISGKSKIKNQRPLLIQDGLFYDENESVYITIKKVVETFQEEVNSLLIEFRKIITIGQIELET